VTSATKKSDSSLGIKNPENKPHFKEKIGKNTTNFVQNEKKSVFVKELEKNVIKLKNKNILKD
jgi:hypothetical protein